MVLLLTPSAVAGAAEAGQVSLQAAIRTLIEGGASEKDALKQVARERALGKSEVYREWQRGKGR